MPMTSGTIATPIRAEKNGTRSYYQVPNSTQLHPNSNDPAHRFWIDELTHLDQLVRDILQEPYKYHPITEWRHYRDRKEGDDLNRLRSTSHNTPVDSSVYNSKMETAKLTTESSMFNWTRAECTVKDLRAVSPGGTASDGNCGASPMTPSNEARRDIDLKVTLQPYNPPNLVKDSDCLETGGVLEEGKSDLAMEGMSRDQANDVISTMNMTPEKKRLSVLNNADGNPPDVCNWLLDEGPLCRITSCEADSIMRVLQLAARGKDHDIPWVILRLVLSAALEYSFCSYWDMTDDHIFSALVSETRPAELTPVTQREVIDRITCHLHKPLPGARTSNEKGEKNELLFERMTNISHNIRRRSLPPFTSRRLIELICDRTQLYPQRVWAWTAACRKCSIGIRCSDPEFNPEPVMLFLKDVMVDVGRRVLESPDEKTRKPYLETVAGRRRRARLADVTNEVNHCGTAAE